MYEIDNEINEIYFIYLLKRKNRNDGVVTFYTGYTNNPLRRFYEHRDGKTKANKGYDVLSMHIVISGLPTKRIAMHMEKYIKNYSHSDKENLIQMTKPKS